jgi:CRISPR-associated endonuclease Csn1
MSKILGIDLGTNSAGWAIRDIHAEDNQIIDYGVITFDKGVASEKGNEFPKVQKRTESRGKRRNYQAEKYRKWALLEFLIQKRMCPLTILELDEWRKYKKGHKRKYPQSEAFTNWLRFDFNGDGKPDFHLFGKDQHESYYIFRVVAIDENYKKVFQNNPEILGRVFYQLVQRRGFRGRDEEEARTMLEGSSKNGTAGRNKIGSYIDKHKTLGAALYHYQRDKSEDHFKVRIRQRYNLRKDYEDELRQICKLQGITDDDYKVLWRSIIWQRPLRTQKGLVGRCIYEKNKKRTQVSHPLYEEYRTWTFINNLKIIPPDGIEKETYLRSKIYPLFYRASGDFKMEVIQKQLTRDGAIMEARFGDKTKVLSAKLLNSFNTVLGDDWKEKFGWENIHCRKKQTEKKEEVGYTYEDIWHVLNTFDAQENLKSFAVEKLRLSEELAEKFSKIKLSKGYATLSLSAIKKVLPYLRKGFPYSQAIYMANLFKVLGSDEITDEMIQHFADEVSNIIEANAREKKLNNIVNALIQDELNSEHRYSIEVDRELDNVELGQIKSKVIDIIGAKTWEREYSYEEQRKALEYVAENFKDFFKKSILSKRSVFKSQPRLHEQIWGFIRETYSVSDEKKKYLWHPSEQDAYMAASEYEELSLGKSKIYVKESEVQRFLDKHAGAEREGRSLKLLGSPEPISKGFKNPMALKTLHKLKNLINYLLQIGKIDEGTRVVVEIARELNNANMRKAIETYNNERERENDSYRKEIERHNEEKGTKLDVNDRTLLRKIRLWHEQGGNCLYTGKKIQITDILNGENFDLEHTIPASISFDSELKNLTLSDVDFNRHVKGKRFPAQLDNHAEVIKNIEVIFGKRIEEVKKVKGKKQIFVKWSRIEDLKDQLTDWKNKASYASDKGYKDYCIQNTHLVKMKLEYLKAKLKTFTVEEYKAGWKNSQIRDTQIVTKYALPYLQTAFKKVSVEKGSVTNAFKEIYRVKLTENKKDRSVHSHHAQDAAILTLIPPFYQRDKILAEYFKEKDIDINRCYHDEPIDWKYFKASYIIEIQENVLINNLEENKTTLPTYKVVRKRGKKVWLDEGKKRPMLAQGDAIRGQLHGESIYGAIKLPLRNDQNQILFDENNKMRLSEQPVLVIRKDLVYKKDSNSPGFKSLDEIEKVIVDKDLFEIIKKQVEALGDFKSVLESGVYRLDKHGRRVNRIRRVRCIEKMKYETAQKIHKHNAVSDKDYKHYTLAKNGENALCLFYKNRNGKGMQILSISEVADLKFENDQAFFNEPYYNQMELGKGEKRTRIPLYAVLRTGCKVLFFKNSIEELRHLSDTELSKRLFKIYQFEGDGRIKFKHHLSAGVDTDLKKLYKEDATFDFENHQVFLRLRQKHWNFAIDGRDFEMKLDGRIDFGSK